jgi:hypothetical protein
MRHCMMSMPERFRASIGFLCLGPRQAAVRNDMSALTVPGPAVCGASGRILRVSFLSFPTCVLHPRTRPAMRVPTVLALAVALLAGVADAAKKQQQLPCPKDPFADPRNDPCNVSGVSAPVRT